MSDPQQPRRGEEPQSAFPPPPPISAPPVPGAAASRPGAGGAAAPTRPDAVEVMRYAWRKFTENPATTLIPVLVGAALQAVVVVVLWGVLISIFVGALVAGDSSGQLTAGQSRTFTAALWLYPLVYLVVVVVFQVVYAGWLKAGLEVTRGNAPSLRDCYEGWDKKAVLVLAALIAVATVIPFAVLGSIPGVGALLAVAWVVAVGVFTQFAPLEVIAHGRRPVAALLASRDLVVARAGDVLLLDLLLAVAYGVGVLACGVGVLVALPVIVIVIAHACMFSLLNGTPVAA